MNIVIPVGWWIMPLAFNFAAIAWALPLRSDERSTGGMFSGFRFFGPAFRLLIAMVLSLVGWLIWALVR